MTKQKGVMPMYYNPYSFYPVYAPYRAESTRAIASIKGSDLTPDLKGYVMFTELPNGTEVTVEVSGLPDYQPAKGDKSPIGPHGFHIHENGDCQEGDPSDPFQSAGGHWNPYDQPHGHHPGDFPVLFSNNGYSSMAFFTNRFRPRDIIGKSVVIHLNPDDYRSQPAGDSGKRIGCGVIQSY